MMGVGGFRTTSRWRPSQWTEVWVDGSARGLSAEGAEHPAMDPAHPLDVLHPNQWTGVGNRRRSPPTEWRVGSIRDPAYTLVPTRWSAGRAIGCRPPASQPQWATPSRSATAHPRSGLRPVARGHSGRRPEVSVEGEAERATHRDGPQQASADGALRPPLPPCTAQLPFPLDLGPGQGETRRPLTVQEPMRLGRSTDASRAVGRPAGTNLRMSIVAAGPHPRHAPSAPAVMAAARAFDGVSRWVGWGSTEPTGWPPRGRTRAPRQRRGPSTRWAPSTASGLHSCPWSECGHTPIHPTQWTPLAHSARP